MTQVKYPELGEKITQARKRAGLSHDRLGAAVGTSRTHLIRLEKGWHKPSDELLAKIAEASGQPLSFFAVKEEVGVRADTFRGAGGDQSRRRAKGAAASAPADGTDVTEGVA